MVAMRKLIPTTRFTVSVSASGAAPRHCNVASNHQPPATQRTPVQVNTRSSAGTKERSSWNVSSSASSCRVSACPSSVATAENAAHGSRKIAAEA